MARQPGAQPLTTDGIHAAGLEIIDHDGIEGLSMRKLGAALGVDPMAIYHHVPNKAALFQGIVEHVFAAMPQPTDAGPWGARVREWAHDYRTIAEAHPHLISTIVTSPAAVATAASRANDGLNRAIADSPLPRKEISRGSGVVVDYVNGAVLASASEAVRGDSALRAELDAGFEFGLDVIVAGLGAASR